MSVQEHKKEAKKHVSIGIISISTTRTLAEDKSGHWIRETAERLGNEVVFHRIIPDKAEIITEMVLNSIRNHEPRVILLTGGTGISHRDVTIEAIRPLFEKELTGFGAVFAQQSFEDIGTSAILSRATAGIIGRTIIFCMPGSLGACQLACSLIFPELGHLVKHLDEG